MIPIIDKAIGMCMTKYNELSDLLYYTDHLFLAAIILDNDDIILGVNVPRSGVVCAEMVALGSVGLLNNFKNAKYIVTITKDKGGEFIVSNVCGSCRQNLLYICPQIKVVVGCIENYSTVGIRELLPYPFERIRKKRD